MAKFTVLTGQEEKELQDWIESRPEKVRELAKRFRPDTLYRMKETNQRCTIYAFSEDGTLIVDITGQFNRILFSRKVFGINPDSLEECDLPSEGEDVGDTAAEAGYTEDDVRNILIPKLREEGEFGECGHDCCSANPDSHTHESEDEDGSI